MNCITGYSRKKIQMKHPLKWYHKLAREMVCWTFGHKWKSSWRSRDDKQDRLDRSDDNKLTYLESCEGNPYFWFSESWHYKCKRCRITTKDEAWYPYYEKLGWVFRYTYIDIKLGWEHYVRYTQRTWKDFFITFLTSIWSFPKNYSLYILWDNKYVPFIFCGWILDIDDWLMMRLSYNDKD